MRMRDIDNDEKQVDKTKNLRRLTPKVKDSLQTYFPVTEFYLQKLSLYNLV